MFYRIINLLTNSRNTVWWLLVLALAWPTLAAANIGIPMLALAWPVHWIALIPIIIVESEFAAKKLALTRSVCYKTIATANVVSTLVGIPATWLLMLLVNFAVGTSLSFVPDTDWQKHLYVALFPLMSAWLQPTENQALIYTAFVCLAIPMWYGSVLIESWVMRRKLTNIAPAQIRRAAISFNALSYLLILLGVGLFWWR